MKSYVRFESPKELTDKVLEAIELARETGSVAKGVNEVTKSIERSTAKLVVIAEDVEPEEVVMHLPPLCEEKDIPMCYAPSKSELGRAAGIDVPCAAVSVVKEGDGKKLIDEIMERVKSLSKTEKPVAEAPAEKSETEEKKPQEKNEKPAPKPEPKPEAKK